MKTTTESIDAAYRAWRSEVHRPAQGRRTVETWAGFVLPHLKPGDRLLDIGCGPGSITFGFAERLSGGEVVGIDLDAKAIESCTKLAAVRGVGNARFEVADATALPFGADEFDVVFASAVLQHVPDPLAIIREAKRVLRPGGLLAISDADLGSSVLWPHDPAVLRNLEMAEELRVADGGTPRIGRMLAVLFAEAGLSDVRVTARTGAAAGAGAVLQAGQWARHLRSGEFQARAAGLGLAGPEECDAMAAACEAWATQPGALWAGTGFEAIGVA